MIRKYLSRNSLKIFFTIFIGLILAISVTTAHFTVVIIHRFFDISYRLPDLVWFIIISTILGTTITNFFSKFFLKPIVLLIEGIRKVADGDFKVHLDEYVGFEEIKNIYKDFNIMVKQLNSNEILKKDFISNVSHEFKTPINAIEGYTTLLQDPDLDDDTRNGYIEKIIMNTNRLSNLVKNILLLSKVDNQGIVSNQTTYRLDEQIRQSIVYLEPKWTLKNNDFEVDLEEITYTGNENLLVHVWNNLIENAIKYGPQDGLIKMKLFDKNNVIIFIIEDEGPGIPDEAKEHIFDRFYQLDNSRRTEGYGLGLALVKQVLNISNGTIKVENVKETGCRFIVSLKK